MEKASFHSKTSSAYELTQTVVGTLVYIAIMALGVAFFVRLLSF